jgi:hypothetical protein
VLIFDRAGPKNLIAPILLKACEHNIQYTIVVKNQVCTKCGTVAAKHL